MTQFDLMICGAGVGGVAAALAAARCGRRVLLSDPCLWVGGQLTSQAVPPDENPWIETHGGTRSFRQFREGVRSYYRSHFPLTADARANPLLNPGLGYVSRLCHEPRVALAVLEAMLAPHISSGMITLLPRHVPAAASVQNDCVTHVVLLSLETGTAHEYSASFVLDATETGDLLPLAGAEYVVGAESQDDTDEPHARPGPARPQAQQGATHCFALSYHPGEDHTIDKPATYDFWRGYTPSFWPGPLLGWTDLHPFTNEPRTHSLFGPSDDPDGFTPDGDYVWGQQGLWHYRRLRARRQFVPDAPEITLVNWPMNDYWLKPLFDDAKPTGAGHALLNALPEALAEASALSLSLLYWLQTEAPHPTGNSAGYPGLKLRPDLVGTTDGLAQHIYVRESRRIVGETRVVEQDIAADLRPSARDYADSVGIGCYRIDLHPTVDGNPFVDIGCHPFQIPLGALLPVRLDNLLPACKNLAVTHITNGAFRLHPVEWAIGEASGLLACYCLAHSIPPRQVRADPKRLEAFQALLTAHGVPYKWPSVYPV